MDGRMNVHTTLTFQKHETRQVFEPRRVWHLITFPF